MQVVSHQDKGEKSICWFSCPVEHSSIFAIAIELGIFKIAPMAKSSHLILSL
jgi:hypothetical protein